MRVINSTDDRGIMWREVICSKHAPLKALALEYMSRGKDTWINPCVDGKWCLTIKMRHV